MKTVPVTTRLLIQEKKYIQATAKKMKKTPSSLYAAWIREGKKRTVANINFHELKNKE